MPSIASRSSLKQLVQHAPGEGAVGAAALQREIDALGRGAPPGARPGNSASRILFMPTSGGAVGIRRRDSAADGNVRRDRATIHSAVQPPSIDRLAPVIALAASEQR